MPTTYSGKALIAILTKQYGFLVVRQKGSHVKLKRVSHGKTISTVVPLHHELAHGTLRGILRLAQIDYQDFLDHADK
jgi:predicted RNA binding protein YcfA (HicA-like mRNA interferase family)